MKAAPLCVLVSVLVISTALLLGCSSPAPTAVPPTTAPTTIPTIVPPSQTPSATPAAPTTAPTTAPTSNADEIVLAAMEDFAAAKTFQWHVSAETAPLFFQGNFTPAAGDDPNKVLLFDMEGEQKDGDKNYTVTGFMASLIGVFSGFDPESAELGIISVGNDVYMRGRVEGETEARWYKLSEADAATTEFEPVELVEPLTGIEYPAGGFTKSGATAMDGQTCDVYTSSRAMFDAVFPSVADAAILDLTAVGSDTVDRAEYKITICPDGKLRGITYNFDAHTKTDPTKKGSFSFAVEVSDYDSNVTIQAPADAIPMPGLTSSTDPTDEPGEEPTATRVPQNFTSLDGEWEGTNDTDSPILFTVEDNTITYANLNYSISEGGCFFGGAYGSSVEDGAIQDDTFTIVLSKDDGVTFTFTGTFASNNTASGTLTIKGETFCGETDLTTDWTAEHISAP